MARDWSELPIDIAASIALKSETFEDFIRFSSVCRSWNRASSLIKRQWRPSSPLPWLLLSDNTHNNPNYVRKCYNISSNKFYHLNLPETFGKRCWGSSYGWIAMVGRDLNVELFNPITKDRIYFPSFEALYNKYKEGLTGDKLDWFIYQDLIKLFVIKVSQGDLHEFVIIVIHDFHMSASFAWPGDRTWTSITVKQESRMESVLVKDGKMFALGCDRSMVYWKVEELCRREIVNPIEYCPPCNPTTYEPKGFNIGWTSNYLVLLQSSGDFLMVLRYVEDYSYQVDKPGGRYYKTLGFRVFILDQNRKSWKEIEDLDNVALFVGENYPLGFPLSSDKCLKRNRIYATDDTSLNWLADPKLVGLDMGIFDYNNSGEIWSSFYDGDDLRPSFPPPIWFVPQF